jgi:hypothetical protein
LRALAVPPSPPWISYEGGRRRRGAASWLRCSLRSDEFRISRGHRTVVHNKLTYALTYSSTYAYIYGVRDTLRYDDSSNVCRRLDQGECTILQANVVRKIASQRWGTKPGAASLIPWSCRARIFVAGLRQGARTNRPQLAARSSLCSGASPSPDPVLGRLAQSRPSLDDCCSPGRRRNASIPRVAGRARRTLARQ